MQKILLYSSANAISNSKDQSLKDMSICQYTDLSIYIDNSQSSSELTDENSVKELYIDYFVMTSNVDKGTKILNQENENHNYDEPTFYTDCSNPITLGYLNKDILTNYSVTDDSKSISFNGKVLKEANINLEDINYTLRFTIHIVNNLNQTFAYNMKLDVNLDDNNGGIYNGYIYKSKSTSGNEYRFFREVN